MRPEMRPAIIVQYLFKHQLSQTQKACASTPALNSSRGITSSKVDIFVFCKLWCILGYASRKDIRKDLKVEHSAAKRISVKLPFYSSC